LRENPKHGYEIKTKIKEILSLFAGVDLKSSIIRCGYWKRRGWWPTAPQKAARRPQRSVYYLTAKGKARFEEL